MTRQSAFPYRIGPDGRTATTGAERHIRDLIEQVLFTEPGERVNRPEFGCGLKQLVFAGNSPQLAAATQLLVQGALQRWLADLIQVEAVEVVSDEAQLKIDVRYRLMRTEERRLASFEREF